MSNSLQDQLLKVGLVSKTDLSKAKKGKRKQRRQKRERPASDESQILARQAQQDKIARDRDLNRKALDRQRRKAAAAEARQLVESNQVAVDGDIAFNFPHKRKVKEVRVDRATHGQLAAGRLAIVRLNNQYRLVPRAVVDKVRSRDPNLFVYCNEPDAAAPQDEAYAQYQVPDDLIW